MSEPLRLLPPRRHLPRRATQAAVRYAPAAGALARVGLRAAPGLLGLALVAYGAGLVYRPAGFIAAGLLVLADVVASRRQPATGGRAAAQPTPGVTIIAGGDRR